MTSATSRCVAGVFLPNDCNCFREILRHKAMIAYLISL